MVRGVRALRRRRLPRRRDPRRDRPLRLRLRRGRARDRRRLAADRRPVRVRRDHLRHPRAGRGPRRRRQARPGPQRGARGAADGRAARRSSDADRLPLPSSRPMAKVCFTLRQGPAFGNSRSHSMVATRRRFDPNLQKVRIDDGGRPRRVYVCTRCLKAEQGHEARLAPCAALARTACARGVGCSPPCRTHRSFASATWSASRWPTSRSGGRRSTTSTCSRSPTATRATTWR